MLSFAKAHAFVQSPRVPSCLRCIRVRRGRASAALSAGRAPVQEIIESYACTRAIVSKASNFSINGRGSARNPIAHGHP